MKKPERELRMELDARGLEPSATRGGQMQFDHGLTVWPDIDAGGAALGCRRFEVCRDCVACQMAAVGQHNLEYGIAAGEDRLNPAAAGL